VMSVVWCVCVCVRACVRACVCHSQPHPPVLHGDQRMVGILQGFSQDVCLSVQFDLKILVVTQVFCSHGDLIKVTFQ